MLSVVSSILRPLVYASVPYLLLRSMASTSPTIRYHVRVSVYMGLFVMLGACSSVIALVMTVTGSRFSVNYVVARTFYFLAGNALDLSIDLEGEEHLRNRPAVLLSNHQSVIDMFVIGKLMPPQTSILSKKSIQYTPLGPFMTMSGAVFIDRGNNARAIRSLDAAAESMKVRKTSLWMYPEGTRTTTEVPSMLPLKKGAFHMAIQAGIPIIPIVTENTWRIFRKGFFGSGTIKVRVLPPISTEGLTAEDVGALSVRVREQMLETLREISVKVQANDSTAPPEETKSSLDKALDAADVLAHPDPEVLQTEPVAAAVVAPSRSSQESMADSSASSTRDRSSTAHSETGSSENGTGTETEEDEGMVLVGRPA